METSLNGMAEINEFDKRDIAVNENEADEAKVDEIKAVAIEKDSYKCTYSILIINKILYHYLQPT